LLLIGSAPFSSKNIKETYNKIKNAEVKIPRHAKISTEAFDIIKVMLNKSSAKRATLEELNEHPFVTDNGKLPCPIDLQIPSGGRQVEDSKLIEAENSEFNNSIDENSAHSGQRATLHRPPIINVTNANNLEIIQHNIEEKLPKVWVINCADYSAKYGLGYLLSSGHVGVYFNDKTKMLLSPKANKFMYTYFDDEGEEIMRKFNTQKLPQEWEKKFRLMTNFKAYLMESYNGSDLQKSSFSDRYYVKGWIRTRHAFAFKLPNKTIQIMFNDKSEIRMIARPNKIVSYVSSDRKVTHYPLSAAVETDDINLAKRLTYTKKIMKELCSR